MNIKMVKIMGTLNDPIVVDQCPNNSLSTQHSVCQCVWHPGSHSRWGINEIQVRTTEVRNKITNGNELLTLDTEKERRGLVPRPRVHICVERDLDGEFRRVGAPSGR